MAQLEIACFNFESALLAQQNGADRVELCDDFSVGGTTPSSIIIEKVRAKLTIDLYVMIRPRSGNFVYNMEELMFMMIFIHGFKEIGVNGFVFGALTHERKIDVDGNRMLVEMADPLPCTFHRAFDEVLDHQKALEDIIECGFKTVLTSGLKPNVVEGVDILAQLVKQANGRIVVMPGGGLRSTNIEEIQKNTNAVFYHSSAITDQTETANAAEIKALKSKIK